MDLTVATFYSHIALVHGLTGFVGKLALALVVGLIAAGNRKPGEQLLLIVCLLQFLMSGYLAVSYLGEAGLGSMPVPVASIAFIMAVVLGIALVKPEGRWTVRHPQPWRVWAGGALLIWALYFPAFNDGWPEFARGWGRAIFLSPVGVLPHSTLLALGALAWLSMPNAPRIVAWASGIGLIALGLHDYFAAGIGWSVVLVALGAALTGDMVHSVVRAGGVLEEDVPPVDKKHTERIRRVTKEKTSQAQQKTWKLK